MSDSPLEYVYGINAVADLLTHNAASVSALYLSSERNDKRVSAIQSLANDVGISIKLCSKDELDLLLSGDRAKGMTDKNNPPSPLHQGVIAACSPLQAKDEVYLQALVKRSNTAVHLLILDGVTDPHNLGACIRSANAAGVQAVVVPKDNAVGLTPVVRKVASGGAETTPLVVVKNLARCIKQLQEQGVWVMGAVGEATKSVYDIDFTSNIALVLGSEGDGLRRLTKERCDELFSIPMTGTVESLNVSVATGICVFEVLRQRQSL